MLALEQSKLFGGLIAEELQALEQTAHIKAYKPGQVIFTEGDPGDGIYVIIEGVVLISALVNKDDRRVLSRVGPGDFFGEMAVLDNEARSATATSEKDTRLYFIPRPQLLNLLESSPKLAISLVREFSLRMREVNRQYIREVLQAERLTLVGRFARSIVHDFKNPLNVIGLAAELAAMEKATPEMRQAAQKRIQRQVTRLSNMINELLEFTRGSQASIVLAETDYAAYVHQLLEELRPEVKEKSVELVLESEPPDLHLLLDPGRLTHVFYNLIHNAVDAMPNGGKIFMRFSVTDKHVVTEFEDTGKGIAPEIATRLFEAFATYGKAQGTGLGLSICKKIIEDHRGTIATRSEPGHGAVFVFTLPLRR
jgi:signal transduction histidine kinase